MGKVEQEVKVKLKELQKKIAAKDKGGTVCSRAQPLY